MIPELLNFDWTSSLASAKAVVQKIYKLVFTVAILVTYAILMDRFNHQLKEFVVNRLATTTPDHNTMTIVIDVDGGCTYTLGHANCDCLAHINSTQPAPWVNLSSLPATDHAIIIQIATNMSSRFCRPALFDMIFDESKLGFTVGRHGFIVGISPRLARQLNEHLHWRKNNTNGAENDSPWVIIYTRNSTDSSSDDSDSDTSSDSGIY